MRNSSKLTVFAITAIMVFSAFAAGISLQSDNSRSMHKASPSTSSGFIPTRGTGSSFSFGSHGMAVNPYLFISSQPAPVGIADYGIGPGGVPYNYTTNSFLGTTAISSISTNGSGGSAFTVQENVVLSFGSGSTAYSFWIQDVAFVQSSYGGATPYVEFIDNVWNMSSGSAAMHNSTISGNGTVSNSTGGPFYYDVAGSSLPGNNINIGFPVTIQLKVVSYTSGGAPAVSFQYNDGYGWVTYDNTIFKFAPSPSYDSGFFVTGSYYNPYGTFWDAELILGGPGGGSSSTDYQSNIHMALDYWNGHNYQAIRNAYNFGSDTAESINDVVTTPSYEKPNGTLYPDYTAAASGSALGTLYMSNQVSTINIHSPVASGDLYVNGTLVTYFTGNDVNITLEPGSYLFAIHYANGTFYSSILENLTAGEFLSISLGAYKVTFTETGLPAGTAWSLDVGGNTLTTTASALVMGASNGTYNYTISTANKDWKPTAYAGTITVSGSDMNVTITFQPVLFSLVFRETGLTAGTDWSVTAGSVTRNSTASTITFSLQNGTYSYTVTGITGYVAGAYSGSAVISGSSATFTVAWASVTHRVTFTDTGLPSGAEWWLNVTGGSSYFSTGSNISFLEANGTYSYHISTANKDWRPSSYVGTFTVSGSGINETAAFMPVLHSLKFIESGLSTGTKWSVTVNGITENSTGYNITFMLQNGSYTYRVAGIPGYSASSYSGTVSMYGAPLSKSIDWTVVTYTVTFTETGLPQGTYWTIIFDGIRDTTDNSTVSFTTANGTFTYRFEGTGPYYAVTKNATGLMSGSAQAISVAFAKYADLKVTLTPSNATVYLNGTLINSANGLVNQSLKQGSYELVVKENGYKTYYYNFTLASGQDRNVTVKLKAIQSSAASSRNSEDIYVLAGILAIIVVIGGAYSLSRRRK